MTFETNAIDRIAETVSDAIKRERQLVEVIGAGTGGGADAALALLCRHPSLLAAAVLCRPRRRWSAASLQEVEQGNGVEVLIVTEPDGVDPAFEARTILSMSGHHARIRVALQAEEVPLCRSWLRRELGADDEIE